MNKTNYSIIKICRVCENEDNLLNLLNDTTENLIDKLKSFVDFHEEDDLPKFICEECKELLEISYKFKDQCLATDLKFRTILEEIKNEDSTIEYLEVKQELTNDEASSDDDHISFIENEDAGQYDESQDEKNQLFPCNDCDKILKSLECLIAHRETSHTGLPTTKHNKKKSIKKKWPCPTCHEVFSYLDYLEHKKIHGKKRYQCDICEKWFEHNYVLTKHKETHLDLERVECETCHNTFKTDQILQRHIQLTHENILVAFCELCGKGFKLRSDLTSHLRSHSDERNYACEICDKKFKTNTNLHKHKRTHLPKEERPGHICEICSKISFSTGSHKNHMRTHTGETPYECTLCPMKFSQYASLHRHQNVHTGERKFKCQLCGSDFVRKEHLNTHMRVHIKHEQQLLL